MATSAPAPVARTNAFFERIRKNGDVALALGVFGMLAILMVPLPPLLLDVFLAFSITLSLLIFLVSLYVQKPVDFSSFPTILLISTVFRLSLNVASTRLILLHGSEGTGAAGHVIEAFGNFVVGGNYVVGFILFCILLTINFMVVTKGAGRVAEVAARFTLDALPGKQMAIDAELNAGLIDEKVARRRRAEVGREADFYGAMDGASKFIKGDAIAAIIIMLINILAGVVIGVVMNGLSLGEALANYTVLTIGDGLAAQIPALIVSAAAGLLVTRVTDVDSASLDQQFGAQLLGNPRALMMLAVLSGTFVLVPGLRIPFAAIAAVVGTIWWQTRPQEAVVAFGADGAAAAGGPLPVTEPRIEELLKVDPLVVEVGLDLVYLVDDKRGGALVERVQKIRRQVASELGVLIPSVHVRDNLRLGAGQYRVLLRGEAVGSGKIMPRQLLALDPGTARGTLQGSPGVDPVYGLKGFWIQESLRLRAQSQGFTVVDVPTVLTTHLDDLFRRHAHELFGRAQLAEGLERVGAENPRLVEELIPDPLPRATVLRVCRNLISEGIGVRDLQGILEALSEFAARTRDAEVLTEFVRQRMARAVTARWLGDDGTLHYVALGADTEDAVVRGLQGGEGGAMTLMLEPDVTRRLIQQMRGFTEAWSGSGELVLLVPPLARGPIRRLFEKALPRVPVLSPGEIVPGTPISREGEVTLADKPQKPLKNPRG